MSVPKRPHGEQWGCRGAHPTPHDERGHCRPRAPVKLVSQKWASLTSEVLPGPLSPVGL